MAHGAGTGRQRLFFALWPEADVRAALASATAALRAQTSAHGRWTDPARYHLTLRFLGDCDAAQREAALRAGAAVQAQAFDLGIDCAGSFRNRVTSLWLGCTQPAAGLEQLWDALTAQLVRAGIELRPETGWVPHVTIARDAHVGLSSTPIACVRWPVREFVLVHSVPGSQPAYRPIARWRLSASAGSPTQVSSEVP